MLRPRESDGGRGVVGVGIEKVRAAGSAVLRLL